MLVSAEVPIYGLHQASLAWYSRLSEFLVSIEFLMCKSDPCFFVLRENGENGFVCIHVDGLLLAAEFIDLMHKVKERLSAEFKLKD